MINKKIIKLIKISNIMSNLLITLIVVYVATVIIQIGYCIAYYNNDNACHNLSAIIILITSIVFAPIMILFEIGVALLYTRLNKE